MGWRQSSAATSPTPVIRYNLGPLGDSLRKVDKGGWAWVVSLCETKKEKVGGGGPVPRSCGRTFWIVLGLVMAVELAVYSAWPILFAGGNRDGKLSLDDPSTGLTLTTRGKTIRTMRIGGIKLRQAVDMGWQAERALAGPAEAKKSAQGSKGQLSILRREGPVVMTPGGAGGEADWKGKGREPGRERGRTGGGQSGVKGERVGKKGERTREEMLKGPNGGEDCGMVEEFGRVSAGKEGEVAHASLLVRKMIQEHFAVHGASAVRKLAGEEFCHRGFVVGHMHRDGLGNNLYKLLTAAGLALMLNRSLVVNEHGGLDKSPRRRDQFKFPFGDYISHTEEAFSVRELKLLWLTHECESKFGRKLEMRTDLFLKPALSRSLCEDWTAWESPLILYKEAEDFGAIQMFQKSRNARMRALALALMGPSDDDRRRPNLFGELMRFTLQPTQAVAEAVDWTLGNRGDPDVAIHLRMMNKTSMEIYTTSIGCVRQALDAARWHARAQGRKPRVALVSDTDESVVSVTQLLVPEFEVVNFNFREWMRLHPDHPVMNNHTYTAPAFRMGDWGTMPRWVAVVDFFIASRARTALVSGASSRVATTFAQLSAALAAANALDEKTGRMPFRLYSSFTSGLLEHGLSRQSGRSFVWQSFSGNLSCRRQPAQCALTPLLPFTWWDLAWQSPSPNAIKSWQRAGLAVSDSGEVTEELVQQFCNTNKEAEITLEDLPLDWPILQYLKQQRESQKWADSGQSSSASVADPKISAAPKKEGRIKRVG